MVWYGYGMAWYKYGMVRYGYVTAYGMAGNDMVQYGTVTLWYGMVLYGMAFYAICYGMVRCGAALCVAVWCGYGILLFIQNILPILIG